MLTGHPWNGGYAEGLETNLRSFSMTVETGEAQKLWSLIEGIRFGMLTHRHANGILHSQPLTTQNKSLDDGPTLYFFIKRDSEIAGHIGQDANVNVSYASPADDSYVCVSGNAAIIEDKAKKEALWSPMAKAWFPGGAGDDNLALMEVRIGRAEYWDVTESKMVQLAKMAKAALTGEQPHDLGEHKELRFS